MSAELEQFLVPDHVLFAVYEFEVDSEGGVTYAVSAILIRDEDSRGVQLGLAPPHASLEGALDWIGEHRNLFTQPCDSSVMVRRHDGAVEEVSLDGDYSSEKSSH